MKNTWKNKTCEGCKFRVGSECRRFPPNISVESLMSYFGDRFPEVAKTDEYLKPRNKKLKWYEYNKDQDKTITETKYNQACSEYKETK